MGGCFRKKYLAVDVVDNGNSLGVEDLWHGIKILSQNICERQQSDVSLHLVGCHLPSCQETILRRKVKIISVLHVHLGIHLLSRIDKSIHKRKPYCKVSSKLQEL